MQNRFAPAAGLRRKRNGDAYMRLTALLSAVLLMFGTLTARAQDLPISAFYGTWQGNGIAENADSLYFAITTRDFDVVIRESGSGFTVTWTTVIRSGGDPNNPDVRRREASLTFRPTDRPGVYESTDSGDPLDGEVLSWARISGNTLSVHQMTLNDTGGFELTTYDRTITGLGMDLSFRRLRDGEQVRSVSGRLIKIAG